MEVTATTIDKAKLVTMFYQLLKNNTINPFAVQHDKRKTDRPGMNLWVTSHTMGMAFVLENAIRGISICTQPHHGKDSDGRTVISIF